MRLKNKLIFLMICLLVGTNILSAAGETDESEGYYFSGSGNDLNNIMLRPINWQGTSSAYLIFSTKYDVESDDLAIAFFTEDKKNLEGCYYTGTQSNWTTKMMDLSKFVGKDGYIGFHYKTSESSEGDGFYIDNIQVYSGEETILFDNGNGSNEWELIGFTLKYGNASSSNTTPPEIKSPYDNTVERNASENIDWIITTIDPNKANKYRVLRNNIEVISPTDYNSGEKINIHIDTSSAGIWNYTIFASDTYGNLASDQVIITVLEDIPLTINITSPYDGDSTTSDSIDVTGFIDGNNSLPSVTVTVNDNDCPLIEYDLNGNNGTYSASVPLSTGDNVIIATATASNYTRSVLITITRYEEINTGNNDGSGSGGSSGSGGGGTSGEAFENILVSETEREYISKDTFVSYHFNSKGNIIRYINFTGLTSSGTTAAKVEILKNTSTLVDRAPPDITYMNLNVWIGNLGWATLQNIADPTINYIVNKSWITQNNIDESTITMNRYSDGKWDPLVTSLIGEDDSYLYFESKTPGFSCFAITGMQVSADEAGGEGIVVQAEPEETSGQTVEQATGQIPGENKTDIPGFGLCIGLSIFLTMVIIIQKNKQ